MNSKRWAFTRVLILSVVTGVLGLLLSPSATPGQQKGDGGTVVGKVWEMTVKVADGKLKDNPPIEHKNGRIRVDGHDLYAGTLKGKKIGTYKMVKANQMKVTFTDNKFKGYVVDCSMALKEPPTWRGIGEMENSDEKLWFEFVFVKD